MFATVWDATVTHNVYKQQHEQHICKLAGRVRRRVTGSVERPFALAGVSLRHPPILEDGQGRISASEAAGWRSAVRPDHTHQTRQEGRVSTNAKIMRGRQEARGEGMARRSEFNAPQARKGRGMMCRYGPAVFYPRAGRLVEPRRDQGVRLGHRKPTRLVEHEPT